jgi:hypothetical protein
VSVFAVHPGYIASDIVSYLGPFINFLFRLVWGCFGWTTNKGALPVVWAATNPKFQNLKAKYFSEMEIKKSSPLSYDLDIAKKIWDISEEMCKPLKLPPV